jgi:glycogen operon protein
LLSQGVPMIRMGDEFGHSQKGNNNAYCQDSEVSWIDWDLDAGGRALLEFVVQVVRIRKSHETFRPRAYIHDIEWLRPEGGTMTEADWHLPFGRCLGARFPGDEELLLLTNAHDGEVAFVLPEGGWKLLLDTSGERPFERSYPLQPRSLALLARAI